MIRRGRAYGPDVHAAILAVLGSGRWTQEDLRGALYRRGVHITLCSPGAALWVLVEREEVEWVGYDFSVRRSR